MSKKEYSNSGVHGTGGYEFQKHCALYIFLEQYNDIKDSKYFICLEHYEDFLFCYLDEQDLIKSIETYQAKKSSEKWTIYNEEFKKIIQKILEVGIDLRNDKAHKSSNYFHNLHFLSNHEISLSKQKDKKKILNTINESNNIIKYNDLYKEIKDELLSLTDSNTKNEIENLLFKYVDFAKTYKSQKQHLVGAFADIFGKSIKDHKASVIVLLSLFRDVENTLNQGHIIALMDKSKRVESKQINEALIVITTKQKAFDEWKSKKDVYAPILKISIKEHNHFEIEFENAFDYFKDLEAVEHQKIFNFVSAIDFSNCYTHEDGLIKIVEEFSKNHNTQFDEMTTKASLLASYIQVREGTK